MMLCYEKMEGGILGLVGTAEIAYAEGSSLAETQEGAGGEMEGDPGQYQGNASGRVEEVARGQARRQGHHATRVQLAPNVQAVPLVDRPGDFLICKAKDKLYLLEIVAHEKEKTAKLKIISAAVTVRTDLPSPARGRGAGGEGGRAGFGIRGSVTQVT